MTFAKDGGWAYCWLDEPANVNRCRTYNWRGQRLYRFQHENDDDDVFVRYKGTGPVPASELVIDPRYTQPDTVWLKNGVVLLPRNDYDFHKHDTDTRMRYMQDAKPVKH